MSPDPAVEQSILRENVRRLVTRDYGWPARMELIRRPVADRPSCWGTFAELGWLGAGLNEELGGSGGGGAERIIIAEELGRGLVLEPFAAHVTATELLAAIGTPAATALLVELIAGTTRAAFVSRNITLASGSLSGKCTFVDGAYQADILLVAAKTETGDDCITRVPKDAGGITVTPYRGLDNHIIADIDFDAVPLNADAMLATGHTATAAIRRADAGALLALSGEALGLMDSALFTTRDYVRTREQFGQPLSAFQSVQHRLADMFIDTELSRSLMLYAAAHFDGDSADLLSRALSATKAQIAEAGIRVLQSAIQLHGGIGVTEDHAIGHRYKRMYVIAQIGGDAEDHVERFADVTDELLASGHWL